MKFLLTTLNKPHASRLVLFGYLLIGLFLTFNISHFKSFDRQLENHYQNMVTSERQVVLIEEMHRYARNRTRYMLEMIVTKDLFKAEDLSQAFHLEASLFIQARNQLKSYPLNPQQLEIIQQQGQLSVENAAIQRRIVELIQNEAYAEAQPLLLENALPEQTRILELLKQLSISLRENADQASTRYQNIINQDERYANLLHSSLLLLIILVGLYSYRQTRQNEQNQEQQLKYLTDEVSSQAHINAMDAHILSEVSDYIALTDADGNFIRTNPNFENILSQYAYYQLNNIWSVLECFTEHPKELIDAIKSNLKKDQAWRNEIHFDDPLNFHSLCEFRPFHSKDINSAAYLIVISDITELKSAQKALETQANIDAITELPNRHYFQSQLAFQTQNSSDRFALLYIDLDDFKRVNDSLGHDYGDQLLKVVSYRMQTLLLEHALEQFTLARIGGDEFAIILKAKEPEKLQKNSEKLAQAMCIKIGAPYEILKHQAIIGCSIGIALYPEHATSTTRIMRCADLAMYDAKEKGKNTYKLYTDQLNNKLEEQLRLEQSIECALSQQNMKLYAQKQFNLQDLTLSGMEILLRWHNHNQVIMPAEFIPFSEQHRLIDKIDNYVLEQACQTIQFWYQCGMTPPRLAINISSQQLNSATFCDTIKQLLRHYQLDGSAIELEVTEYSLVENIEQYAQNENSSLRQLEKLGVQISIDDFGTGYSSLAYLKHLNIDRLKIDRSFIQDMTTNADSLAIVKSIITLGHSVGAKVLAEGIETEEQLALLQSLNCDEGQGFLLHKPEAVENANHQKLSA